MGVGVGVGGGEGGISEGDILLAGGGAEPELSVVV